MGRQRGAEFAERAPWSQATDSSAPTTAVMAAASTAGMARSSMRAVISPGAASRSRRETTADWVRPYSFSRRLRWAAIRQLRVPNARYTDGYETVSFYQRLSAACAKYGQ